MSEDMTPPEPNDADITPQEAALALPDVPDAGAVPAEKKERRANPKVTKGPTATKAARGRKAPVEKKEKTLRPEKRRIFDKSMLPPETRERVEQRFQRLDVLGRKTTENMLDMGEEFHGLALDVEDPKDWEDLVKANADYEVKTARNWKAVFAKMGHRRAEIIAHKVTPTVLIKLLPANEETIDAVISSFAEGKRLKVFEVKALVDASKEPGEAGADGSARQGGAKGMRLFGLAKLARQQKSVIEGLKAIRQTFAAALEAKKLEKGKLAGELVPIARLAHRELTEILCDIDPKSLVGGVAMRHVKVEDPTWAKLLGMLYTMAAPDGWPDKVLLKSWMTDKVTPLLAFAIDGAAVPSKNEVEVAEGEPVEGGIEEEVVVAQEPQAIAAASDAPGGGSEPEDAKAVTVASANSSAPSAMARLRKLRADRSNVVSFLPETQDQTSRAGREVTGPNGAS
ncbi:hypothetical protein [Aureimonas glaciei]|uniref:Uncharacterized protein n=1 Tax=Aureimonas glaciei TaxID=1776957 RepID=A0A916YEJ8_9HYPH|nr:hypothetical protein [Aureimonas glaciei]GGD42340.1 hypothetical protein GCM10011335_51300 [Aureimonas glaciei]